MFKKVKHHNRTILLKHSSKDEQNDDIFYRCKVCGWICNDTKVYSDNSDQSGRTVYTDGNQYSSTADENVTVKRGCPSCGTLVSK